MITNQGPAGVRGGIFKLSISEPTGYNLTDKILFEQNEHEKIRRKVHVYAEVYKAAILLKNN